MTEWPALPPLLRPLAVPPDLDPFAHSIKVAGEGAEAGTLLWSHGQDACACAVVLAPERPLEPSLPIVLIAMLAEGLGALAPAAGRRDLRLAGPDRGQQRRGRRRALRGSPDRDSRRASGLARGRLSHRLAWLQDAGKAPDDRRRTTPADEGCGDVMPIDLLEAFGRHFVGWINRWREDGVRPVKQASLSRAPGLGKHVEIRFDDRVRTGTFQGLTETGAMRLVRGGVAQTIALDEAMKTPTWSI